MTKKQIAHFVEGEPNEEALLAHLNEVVDAVNDLGDTAQAAPVGEGAGGGELKVWLLVDAGSGSSAQLVLMKGSLIASPDTQTSQG